MECLEWNVSQPHVLLNHACPARCRQFRADAAASDRRLGAAGSERTHLLLYDSGQGRLVAQEGPVRGWHSTAVHHHSHLLPPHLREGYTAADYDREEQVGEGRHWLLEKCLHLKM